MRPVQLTRNNVTLEYHSQDPFSPHPVFPQWSEHSVYPYPFWGSMYRRAMMRSFFMPTLENEYLRVTIAADVGGRIWDVYDKVGKRHLANYNVGVRCYNAGFGLNYTTGGIEVNYPLAHACTTNTKREVSFRKGPDGAAAIIISEYERIWRTRWSMTYTLYPARSYLEQRVRIYNRTPQDSRYMYWNNCGFVLKPSSQYIFPEDTAAMHGQEWTTFSWPIWQHRDMSLFKEIAPQPLGLYYLDAREPFFGYYDNDEQFGLVHYADLADVPGRKYWTWGNDPDMNQYMRKTHHTLDEIYGEVQAGRIVIQEHMDRVPPETAIEWTERWYPVRGTGAFNGAGPGAALRADMLESGEKKSRLRVRIMANAAYPNARLVVASDGITPIEQPVQLDPTQAVERIVAIPAKAGPDQHTMVTLYDRAAGILARGRLRHPNKRDSWREVITVKTEVAPVGVEEVFRAAEIAARDWGNCDLKSLYEKVLPLDSGFGPARKELGKIALWRGLPEEAVKHLEIAYKRDPDSFEIRYFLGLALRRAGRVADARAMFELAARYDWEMRSLARLAELRMAEKDWHHALEHLDRIATSAPRLTRPRCLRAVCLRKLGLFRAAGAEIAAARAVDAQDPFLQYEEMFIRCKGVKRLPATGMKALLEQVRQSELPLIEAAFDYFGVGLCEEAEAVLKAIPQAGALALFLLAYTQEKLGRKEALATLRRACKADPVRQHAWHLEFIEILNWARTRLPKDPRPAWHLGNLFMARRRADEGAALWREAETLGEKHYLLYANLAFYERRVAAKPERALEYFRKSDKLSGGDLYVKHELFATLKALKKNAEAQKYLEGQMPSVEASPRIASDLLNTYLDENRFDRFDALCERLNFPANWQISGPHTLWFRRQMQEALRLAAQKKEREALNLLLNIKPMPPRLGMLNGNPNEDERRYYHVGRLCEKLGNMSEAKRYWEKALETSYTCGYEPGVNYVTWNRRYYQALCLQKLGRQNEATAILEGIELAAQTQEMQMSPNARRTLMDLTERGRFAPEDEKDPAMQTIEIKTRVEL